MSISIKINQNFLDLNLREKANLLYPYCYHLTDRWVSNNTGGFKQNEILKN